MEANNYGDSASKNNLPATEEAEAEQEGPVTDARGGDITSSIPAEEGVGDTAPLTGVLLDPETGAPLSEDVDDNSPY